MKKTLLCLILLLLSAQSYADVVLNCDKYKIDRSAIAFYKKYPSLAGTCSILIKGTIRQEDLSTFKRIINLVDKKGQTIKTTRDEYGIDEYGFSNIVVLDSSGGDAITALAIGDLIYGCRDQLEVLVRSCSSSCVFILGSSIRRFVTPLSEVKIHRPYSVVTNRSYEQIKSDFANLERIAVSQFKRVGVSPDLWNAMMSIPPEKSRRLSDEEMTYFGLNRNDPAYDDAIGNAAAERLGITKQEYVRRKAIFDRCYEQETSRRDISDFSEGIKILNECSKHAGLGIELE
jgi:hypothetical protein